MTDVNRASAEGYSLDTNIIIDGRIRSYSPDVFVGLWASVRELIINGRAIIADQVLFELGRGDDDCCSWASAQPNFVAASNDEVLSLVAQITHDFQEWVSEQANWADPFVVAHARCRKWAVVTNERWSRSSIPSRVKIPNVCDRYGVECLSFIDLIRREEWTF